MEQRDRHANAALDLNMRLQTDWLAGGRHGDEWREGRLEDSLRLVRGTEAVRLEGRSKRERREKERDGQNFLLDIPRFLGSCTSEGGRW